MNQHHTVRRDGLNWHVVTSGPEDAPPLLLLHCWTGSWRLWERTLRHLAGPYRCIAPDHLGFGQSSKPAGDHYQIDQQAERAYLILRHFGYESARVIGHSMGGQIALTLAGLHPKAVRRLIVVDPAVTGRLHPIARLMEPAFAQARKGNTLPLRLMVRGGQILLPLGLLAMTTYFPRPWQHFSDAFYWGGRPIAEGQTLSSAWAQHSVITWDATPLLARITAPTLAIWGAKDWCVPVDESDVLAAHIPDFHRVILPGIGHFPMIEAFDRYLAEVRTFLGEADT